MGSYIVGITGASGSIYGVRLIEELLVTGNDVHIVITDSGKKVIEYETGYHAEAFARHLEINGNTISGKKGNRNFSNKGKVIFYEIDNLFAAIASGSFKTDGMIVLPCSMSTLAEIANGISKNLLTRAADVCIKEKRKLVIVPRETPLSTIHLKNMLALSETGVTILPAMPGFYHKPQSMEDLINFVVGKVLDTLNIENQLFEKWGK